MGENRGKEREARERRQAANRAERAARAQARKAERDRKREAAAPREDVVAPEQAPQALPSVPRRLSDVLPPDLDQQPLAPPFQLLLIGQGQRIGLQALLFVASLRHSAPDWTGSLIVAEPQPQAAWQGHDTLMPDPIRGALQELGAQIVPFVASRFGADYPYGNKIEALSILSPDLPFVFFDSDTLITGPIERLQWDFARPSASMRRTGTWPEPPPYGPGYGQIWKSLYDRFGLDFASSLDMEQPDEHWERYLYFNAGWFMGQDAARFGSLFADWAQAILADPGEALACQSLDPWLDQITLPLVIHALGGGRPDARLAGLDGWASCHYRNLPLLYARESDRVLELVETLARHPLIEPVLRKDGAAQRLIYEGQGRQTIRPLFAEDDPPAPEPAIRRRLRQAGLWLT